MNSDNNNFNDNNLFQEYHYVTYSEGTGSVLREEIYEQIRIKVSLLTSLCPKRATPLATGIEREIAQLVELVSDA